jgi:AcrR family transcriptional regulator
METGKYKEEKSRISKVAYGLFIKKGFARTTIKDIADASGIGKALVQYYFPKKEIFIYQFINDSIENVAESIVNDKIDAYGSFNTMYLIGYFETWYLTKYEKMNVMRNDILESRNCSQTVINTIQEFVFRYIDPPTVSDREMIKNSLTVAIGGEFEFIYKKICDGEDFSIEKIIDELVIMINKYINFVIPPVHVEDMMSKSWMENKALEIDKIMFE